VKSSSITGIGHLSQDTPHEIYACDGVTFWHVLADGTFTKQPASPHGRDLNTVVAPPSFLDPAYLLRALRTSSWLTPATRPGRQGVRCSSPFARRQRGAAAARREVLLRPRPFVCRIVGGAFGTTGDFAFRHIRLDAPLKRSDFAFKKPAFATARWLSRPRRSCRRDRS